MASRISQALGVALLAALTACALLYLENRSLRSELEAHPAAASAADSEATSGRESEDPDEREARDERPANPVSRLLFRGPRPTPETVDEPKKETRQERRQRRQLELEAMFGRLDGETEDEYRERMVPFVKSVLAQPRERLAEARKAAEEAAGVTEEQRGKIDAALGDAYNEVMALTNEALQTGDLTPYSRNWSGALNYAGGVGAILEGTENRMNEILGPEQRDAIYDRGFEWGEYLGVTAPWEQLNPPPPPPGS